jgi:hypothetical protein
VNIDAALDDAEAAVNEGRGLHGVGFWPAVARLRTDPALAGRYADRVAAIDRRAFERGVSMRVRAAPGVAALTVVALAGVAAVVAAGRLHHVPQTVLVLAGLGLLVVSTHSLAHAVVGRALGIRFTHVFVAGRPPEPGVKIDYASYLRATPTARAIMHASGAVVTKIVPFALLPVVFAMRAWRGTVWILLGVGVVMIATDVFVSTRKSDWMKVRREIRCARRRP